MIKFWSICHNTFVQTIRQPIFGILILVTFAVLVLDLPLSGWTMETDYHAGDQKMLESLGLSTLLISGLLIAVFSASSVLSREIDDKTALTVISKPVSRATFVSGKFIGVALAVAVAFYLCSLVFLMTVRHKVMPAASDQYDIPVIVLGLSALGLTILTALLGNLLFNWSFISTGVWGGLVFISIAMGLISFIGKGWLIVPFGTDINPQLLVGLALMFMAVLIFVAVAVAASTRLGQIATLLICMGVFFVGSMHPYLFGKWAADIVAVRMLGWAAPKLTYFYPLDALSMEKDIPLQFVGFAGAYCGLYVAAVLAIGMALFQKRQLEAQATSSSMPGLVGLLAWAGRGGAIAMAIACGVIISQPAFYNVSGFATAGALLAGAILAWVVWGYFGRGVKWTYYLVLIASAIKACVSIFALVFPDKARQFVTESIPQATAFVESGEFPVIIFAAAIVAVAVVVIMFLPKTRRHFAPSS